MQTLCGDGGQSTNVSSSLGKEAVGPPDGFTADAVSPQCGPNGKDMMVEVADGGL